MCHTYQSTITRDITETKRQRQAYAQNHNTSVKFVQPVAESFPKQNRKILEEIIKHRKWGCDMDSAGSAQASSSGHL